MKTKKLSITLGLLIAMVIAASACSVDIERNTDGSLKVESSMTEASLQAELEAAIADSPSETSSPPHDISGTSTGPVIFIDVRPWNSG